jgi:hypothetical protein
VHLFNLVAGHSVWLVLVLLLLTCLQALVALLRHRKNVSMDGMRRYFWRREESYRVGMLNMFCESHVSRGQARKRWKSEEFRRG